MEKIYLVYDVSDDKELVSVNRSMSGAREAVYNHLVDGLKCYTAEEWAEVASDFGYDSVANFQEAIRQYPDYDGDLEMLIEEEILLP